MAFYSFKQDTILIDTRTGKPTRDLLLLLQYLNTVASDLATLVVAQTIVNGDLTHAPSGNAVFDGLALKANTADLVSTLLIDSIADSDITHAPTRNAVFDALALKQGLDSQLTVLAGLAPSAGDFTRWTGLTTAVTQPIVGTVSQSAGVATGAIVEKGSNSNGEYVRFADGTQICIFTESTNTLNANTASGNMFVSSSTNTWTFPAAFANTTNLVASGQTSTTGRWLSIGAPSTSAVTYLHATGNSSATARTSSLVAAGRWY